MPRDLFRSDRRDHRIEHFGGVAGRSRSRRVTERKLIASDVKEPSRKIGDLCRRNPTFKGAMQRTRDVAADRDTAAIAAFATVANRSIASSTEAFKFFRENVSVVAGKIAIVSTPQSSARRNPSRFGVSADSVASRRVTAGFEDFG